VKRLGVLLVLVVLSSLIAGTVSAEAVVARINFVGVVDTQYSISTGATEWKDLWNFSVYHSASTLRSVSVSVSPDPDTSATVLKFSTGGGYWQNMLAVYNSQLPYVGNASVKVTFAVSGKNYGVGVLVITKSGTKYAVIHYHGNDDGQNDNKVASYPSVTNVRIEDLPVGGGEFVFDPVRDLQEHGVAISSEDISYMKFFVETVVEAHYNSQVVFTLSSVEVVAPSGAVTFRILDGLSGKSLTGVTVKEGSTILGTLDDGQSLELTKGQHTLTFEKPGYWSTTKTINVQGDMSVSVELYPSSAAFKLENFPSDITIPENTIYTLTFTVSPINTNATYNTYLSLAGLSNILEVRKDGSVISPEGGKYYLGDISGPTQVSIKFKATSVGTYAFSLTLESHDAFGTKTYTTTKQVKYKVDPLPFTVEMPSEWQVGDNQLRVSEASGQSYAMVVVLKDSSGSQVWSDSYAFNPYDVHTFTVSVPKEGTYTLEFQWAGKVASYTINVGTGISLLTKSVSVKRGGVGTVQVQLKNPSDSTKYYTIRLEGGFLDVPVNQTVAIAPSSTKTVSISFAVPDKLTYDAYDLTLKILEGDAERYSGTVHVIITGSEAGLPIGLGGGSGLPLLAIGAAAGLGLGLFWL